MSNKEEKMKQGFKDREKYLEAKEKFDRLNKHIEEYKNGTFKHKGPKISFITRTQGKRHEALEEIFLCMSSQTCHDFELVLIPHKVSSEKLEELTQMVNELPEWLQKQTRICPLNEGNRTTPLNYGFSIAKGLYAAIIDDDDLMMEDWVEEFSKTIDSDYGRIIHGYSVQQDWTIVNDKENRNLLRAQAEPIDIYCRPFSIENELTVNFCPPIALAFPLYAFNELGIKFDETLDTTEDWDYLMRVAAICGVADVKKVVAVYRIWKNGENSHTQHSKKVWDDNYKLLVKRFSDLEIVFPFKENATIKYPIHVDIFYSDRKGNFTVKKRICPAFDHDEKGMTIIKVDDFSKYGPIGLLRIDPDTNGNRLVNNLKVEITLDDGSIYPIEKASIITNGVEHADHSFTFLEDDPQICFKFGSELAIKSLQITYFIDVFIKDTKYKPKKVRRSFVKRCKSKIKKILRWIKQRL